MFHRILSGEFQLNAAEWIFFALCKILLKSTQVRIRCRKKPQWINLIEKANLASNEDFKRHQIKKEEMVETNKKVDLKLHGFHPDQSSNFYTQSPSISCETKPKSNVWRQCYIINEVFKK